jgi:hypothetical protein
MALKARRKIPKESLCNKRTFDHTCATHKRQEGDEAMANEIYKVYLCDVLGCVPRGSILQINITLQSFFQKIVATAGSGFQSALVHWLAYQPTPEPHELLLYFIPDRSLSVVKEAGGPAGGSGDGLTWWRDSVGAVSEVYTSSKQNDPAMLPLVGFHELMHNKLRLGDALLHPKGGLAGDPVAGGAPSPSNIADMAAALKRAAPQWAKGVSIMANGRTDPMSRYYQV